MAMALALAPLGAASARARQAARAPVRSHTQICINGQCTEDTSRVVVLRLMDKVDSLKRIYLDKPITPDERERMAEQMSDWIRQLTDLSQNAMVLGLQQADEATRQAMNDAAVAQRLYRVRVMPRMTADAAPKGWIGFTTAGAPLEDVRDGEYYVQFLDYPEVETVEPASPAERAGIVHGDVLVSFNGQDVTSRAISMTRLLRPDHKIILRMERNGQPREFAVVVAKAPQNYVSRIDDFTAPRAPDALGAATPSVAPAPAAVYFPKAPTPPGGVVRAGSSVSFNFEDAAGVAGASMSTLNADFARNLHLGVDHGVLVINAPSGTPAAEAGLRNADVIVKVGGQDVATVRELRRALERRAAVGTIELQIIRDKHKRTIKFNND
jgi:serine protease Do